MKKKATKKRMSAFVPSHMVRVSNGVRHASAGLLVIALAVVGLTGFADEGILTNLGSIGKTAWGTNTSSVGEIIGGIIQVFLGFLGIIFLILTLYAGFLWMTAAGASEKVETAQKMLMAAVIGLIIIIAAQGITYWVLVTVANQVK